MQLKSLTLTNFRGIQDLKLEFSEQVNVLLGVNGAGKTAILDCAAIMLSRLIVPIRSTRGTRRSFTDYDISNGISHSRNQIDLAFQGRSYQWSVTKTRRGCRQQTTRLEEIKGLVDLIHSKLEADDSASLPLVVYYPVDRAVVDIPLRIRNRHQFDQIAAYDQALSGDRRDFRTFFEWFRDREDLENEQRLENPPYRDRQLQAVRLAIARVLLGSAVSG